MNPELKLLMDAANKVWNKFRKWGPVDDGTKEGAAFENALIDLQATIDFLKDRHKKKKKKRG